MIVIEWEMRCCRGFAVQSPDLRKRGGGRRVCESYDVARDSSGVAYTHSPLRPCRSTLLVIHV
jgi:hypothetical protein